MLSGSSLFPERQGRRWLGTMAALLTLEVVAVLGWVAYAVSLARGHGLTAQHLFPDSTTFTDAFLYRPVFDYYHTDAFNHEISGHARFAYPPILAPAFSLFYAIPHRMSGLVLLNVGLWCAFLVWTFRQLWPLARPGLERVVLIGSLTLSFPAIFLLQRGNAEVAVWALTVAGLCAFATGGFSLCAVALGLAAASKIYPVLLFGLFLSRRLLGSLALAAGTTLVATCGAIWYTGPTFSQAAHGFAGGLGGFQQTYAAMLRSSELMYDHSLFSVVKTVARHFGKNFNAYSHPYYVLGAFLFGSLFVLLRRQKRVLNLCLFLVVCMVLLPPVSYTYTLVHLYVPGVLIAAAVFRERARVSFAGAATLACLAALMLPINVMPETSVLLAGQWQSGLLFVLAVLACFAYWRGDEPEQEPKHRL